VKTSQRKEQLTNGGDSVIGTLLGRRALFGRRALLGYLGRALQYYNILYRIIIHINLGITGPCSWSRIVAAAVHVRVSKAKRRFATRCRFQ